MKRTQPAEIFNVPLDHVDPGPKEEKMIEKPHGLLVSEAQMPLRINGVPAAEFIKRAYDLGADLNGPGRFDMDDSVQAALRNIKGWIEMASRDALRARGER